MVMASTIKTMTIAPSFVRVWCNPATLVHSFRELHSASRLLATPNRGAHGHNLSDSAPEVNRGCPACPYKEEIDYKNVRFLSQFVSPQTGQILRRSSTGLCSKAQRKVAKAIKRSRHFGLMPFVYRAYAEDPVFSAGKQTPIPSSR
eukprot:gene1100-4328_t